MDDDDLDDAEQDDDEPDQDGAGDGAGDDEDGTEGGRQRPGGTTPPQPPGRQRPSVGTHPAERDEAGEWHTAGEPVPDKSWRPDVATFDAGSSLIMRIVDWHANLVYKLSTQAFDSASGSAIVMVAGDRDCPAKRADKWRNGPTRLRCVAVTPKTLGNLKSDVTGANTNVLRISYAEIDVSDIYSTGG